MRLIFYISLFLSTFKVSAQTDYFAKAFDVNEGSDGAWTVIVENDGYFFCGAGTAKSLNGWASIKLYKTDLEGNLLWTKIHGETNYAYFGGLSGSCVDDINGGYTLGGSFNNSNRTIEDIHLYRFTDSGDTLWRKTYGGSNFDVIFQTIQTKDKGYALFGQTMSFGDVDGDYYLIKTDSVGNFEWQQIYGSFFVDKGLSIEITQDNGFILSGVSGLGPGDAAAYVIKTDSLGNIEWDTTYGTQGEDAAGFITTSRDGGYILWGALDTTITFGDMPLVEFVYKLDANGNVIWRSFFNSPESTLIHQLRELPNGDIVFIGEKIDTNINMDGGWIVKLDKDGNKLWERLHLYTEDTLSYRKTVKFMGDFQQTPDSGFIVTGIARSKIGPTSIVQQDVLIMKLDSMGCLIPGCDTITGINEIPTPQAEINILPNPFSHSATVAIRLQGNDYSQELNFNLYNLSGQLLQSKELHTNQYGYTEFQLQRNGMPSGIYFYELISSEGLLGRGKILVQ